VSTRRLGKIQKEIRKKGEYAKPGFLPATVSSVPIKRHAKKTLEIFSVRFCSLRFDPYKHLPQLTGIYCTFKCIKIFNKIQFLFIYAAMFILKFWNIPFTMFTIIGSIR
jgi:hypothetical protein